MRPRLPRGRSALVFLALVCALAVPATVAGADGAEFVGEQAAAPSSAPTFEGTGAWFAQLKGSAADFRKEAKAAGLDYAERFAFSKLWNGVSVQIAPGQLDKLEGLGSVTAVYPVLRVPMPETTQVSEPDLQTALAMTGADIAQTELGLTGAGVKVAVMDTGIDYDHADLGGDGTPRSNSSVFPTSRVIAGFDLVGDTFNASGTGAALVPNPDPFPDDCNGHGSHVSGIVGANAASATGVTGVAPEVSFGAYRVFGCGTGSSTTADIMIAAMERALADDMDVLNMSIGAAFQTWPQYPTAQASDALVDAGMVVVASIGNSGASGLYSAGAPGVGNKVIGVASFENTHSNLAVFTVSPDNTKIGYTFASGSPPAPTSGSLPLAKPNTVGTVPPGVLPADDGCAAVPAGTFTGSAVLVRRGTCGFYVKAFNAMSGGAAAVILYNNVAGRVNPTVAPPTPADPPITIPVVAISAAEGVLIHNRIAAGPTTLTWTEDVLSEPNPLGGTISGFSSYGLNAELTVKPDIGAPGGQVRSTWPLELGKYNNIGGTSMSSPHVAGAAALLREARPSLPAGQFRDVLQNSADPKVKFGMAFLDNVHRQGAGMVDIDDAIESTTTVTPGKLSLGEGSGGTKALTISNSSGSSKTYDLSHEAALATGPSTFAPAFFNAPSIVSFSSSSVSVPAGGSVSVTVTISPNAGLAEKSLYGGYVKLSEQGTGRVYRVPFAGFKGDYQSIVAMPRVPLAPNFEFPAIGRDLGGGVFDVFPIGVGGTWTLASPGQIPYVLIHFDHQSRRIEIEVQNANGQKVHPVFSNMHEENFLPRNSGPTGFFAFPWNGTRMHDKGGGNGDHRKVVPDGEYKLVVKILKALGDPGNPAHLETWTSPTITIDRP